MGERIGMKMAKASEADLRAVHDFFTLLEEVIEHGTYTPFDPDFEVSIFNGL